MLHEPRIFLRGYGPRSARRRQLRTLGWVGIVLILLGLSFLAGRAALQAVLRHRGGQPSEGTRELVLPLTIQASPERPRRYGLVKVSVKFVDPQGQPVSAKKPQVVVKYGTEEIGTIGDRDEVELRFDKANGLWRGRFPMPWNALPGTYGLCATAELDPAAWQWDLPEEKQTRTVLGVELPEPDEKEPQEKKAPTGSAYAVARTSFDVAAPPAPPIVPGFCVATLETTTDLDAVRVRAPDGRVGDWRNLLEWAEFMDADALFYVAGQTASYGKPLPESLPWVEDNVKMTPDLAAEAHRRHLQFGAWIAAYMTWYGSKRDKPKYYRYSIDYSRGTGKKAERDYVSFLDEKRIQHIAKLMQRLEKDPNVDYIGLDYIRTEESHCYELTDSFAQEMQPAQLPDNWNQRTDTQRMAWLAERIERPDENVELYEEWNWWRARQTALIVERLKRESKITKPFFLFTLSWHRGEQHGQDPIMLTDAGADFLNVMLYQTMNRLHFDVIIQKWHEYTHQSEVNIVAGDEADTYWHRENLKGGGLPVPAPEELNRRMCVAQDEMHSDGPIKGAFFHDLGRITLQGRTAPYPGKEWAIAGAAAFSSLRSKWGRMPVVITLDAPTKANLGGSFPVTVVAENTTEEPVEDVTVRLYDTEGTSPGGPTSTEIDLGTLELGQKRTISFTVKLGGSQPARQSKFMVAAKATWKPLPTPKPQKDTPRIGTLRPPKQCVAFDYVQGV